MHSRLTPWHGRSQSVSQHHIFFFFLSLPHTLFHSLYLVSLYLSHKHTPTPTHTSELFLSFVWLIHKWIKTKMDFIKVGAEAVSQSQIAQNKLLMNTFIRGSNHQWTPKPLWHYNIKSLNTAQSSLIGSPGGIRAINVLPSSNTLDRNDHTESIITVREWLLFCYYYNLRLCHHHWPTLNSLRSLPELIKQSWKDSLHSIGTNQMQNCIKALAEFKWAGFFFSVQTNLREWV